VNFVQAHLKIVELYQKDYDGLSIYVKFLESSELTVFRLIAWEALISLVADYESLQRLLVFCSATGEGPLGSSVHPWSFLSLTYRYSSGCWPHWSASPNRGSPRRNQA